MTRPRTWLRIGLRMGLLAALLAAHAVPALAESHVAPSETAAGAAAPGPGAGSAAGVGDPAAGPAAGPHVGQSAGPAAPAEAPPPTLAQLQTWEYGWSRDERRQVQRALQLLGLYSSGIDGILGRWSRTGIQAFQQRWADEATGYLTPEQRITLAVDAALEAERQAEAAAERARAAAAAPNAEEHRYETGNVYRGDRDRKGYGVYEWTDGHRYEGGWDNTRDGFGMLILANGWRYAGQWQDGIFIGHGVAEGADGTRQLGEWNVPQGTQFSAGLNGYGQITAADGTVSRGLFAGSVLVPTAE